MDRYIKAIQEGNVSYFYKSKTWQKKRKEILERDNNECQLCKREGRHGAGEIVHHVKELKKAPHLALVDSNLLTVCNNCHETVCHPNRSKIIMKKKIIIEERWE